MKKFLLFIPLLGIGLLSHAQSSANTNVKRYVQAPDGFVAPKQNPNQQNHGSNTPTPQHRGGARNNTILHSQRLGSAGNLLSVIESNCKQIDVVDSLNLVSFIHRSDTTSVPGTNVGQYRYDISRNRGLAWTNNIGPITIDTAINPNNVNGRFPQALIYNPAGNLLQDSAHLVYAGTWHDNVTWCGQLRGRGELSGDVSTYNVHIDPINNRHTAIATGLNEGAPGTFWNLNIAYTGTFAVGADAITSGLIIQKGVWNNTTRDVDWTSTTLPQSFEAVRSGTQNVSIASSYNIAFDPSGQFGWIVVLGDITADLDSVYDPLFWKTIDGGQNWTGPITVDLDNVQGVKKHLAKYYTDPNTGDLTVASGIATSTFQGDISVDSAGNPHLLTVVGNVGLEGNGYSSYSDGWTVWDITFDPNGTGNCQWKGIPIADIGTWNAYVTDPGDPNNRQNQDNRPLISRTSDGTKLFFFWLETDSSLAHNVTNGTPNIFGRGIDISSHKMTGIINFSEGDTLWGGETAGSDPGVFLGTFFPTVAPTCLINGSNYNVPLVITQVDYNHDPSLGYGSSNAPAAFWYVDNINFPAAAFTLDLDQVPPTITLNGNDTVTVLVGTTYTELGATAFDCEDGNITPVVQGSPNANQQNVYTVLYIATDAAGNSDTVKRTVIVGAIPVADFTWSFPQVPYKAQFTDQSLNSPTSWVWTFGNGSGSAVQNPSKVYTNNQTYHVCLKAKNTFGTSDTVCKDVFITGVGINDIEFAKNITVFPNPTNDKVYINMGVDATSDMTVTVYNMLGEVVVAPLFYGAGTTHMEMNLGTLANGIYMVKIKSNEGTAIKTLAVEHK